MYRVFKIIIIHILCTTSFTILIKKKESKIQFFSVKALRFFFICKSSKIYKYDNQRTGPVSIFLLLFNDLVYNENSEYIYVYIYEYILESCAVTLQSDLDLEDCKKKIDGM